MLLESFTLDHNLSFLQKGQQPDLSLMWTVGANFVVMGAESLLLTLQLLRTKRIVSSLCKYLLLTRKSLSVLTLACDNMSWCCVTPAQDGGGHQLIIRADTETWHVLLITSDALSQRI